MTPYEIASVSVSTAAFVISVLSIILQLSRQKWLCVKLLEYRVYQDNYVRLKLTLINRKNRKHSVSSAKIKFDKCKDKFIYLDVSFQSEYMTDLFQEGESKFVVFYCPVFPENNFRLIFYTDGRSTKISPRTIRKYLKETRARQGEPHNNPQANP